MGGGALSSICDSTERVLVRCKSRTQLERNGASAGSLETRTHCFALDNAVVVIDRMTDLDIVGSHSFAFALAVARASRRMTSLGSVVFI